ncbi:MAG: HVO_0476 family zinc finger protein [Candidatus Methanomethylophilaceae archaeon]
MTNDKRVKKARAPKVKTIWAQKFDVLNVKVTVNDGTKSYSRRIPALPDDEYAIGQLLSLEDMDCFVHAIKTRDRLINQGNRGGQECGAHIRPLQEEINPCSRSRG